MYGKVRKETEENTNFVPFLFQGQYLDTETELVYNYKRYYSQETGAYISQDPIGLAGGNPTLYGYVFDSNIEIDPFGLGCVENKREGLRREDTLRRILEDIYGKDRVLSERTLVDANGNKVTHKGKGRRVDFIVLDDNGNAIKSFEVTSKTADKTRQIRKENAIRSNGGTFIKDSNGNLVDVSNVPTQIIRIK
ncbi:RHS repeat-associated core domain-containing protein [Treponema pedis]|uniref:RHS repeat-associated core domain-containing protein n=1 Tax=Treponema pedis TaxID=409322 RepID=UPI0021F2D48E|nr:RHS repeat-associated core domain-containing protein [Treponema pedis]